MDNKRLAEEIIEKVGGKSNIESVTNCVTRLRLVLKDENLANDEAVKGIAGVKGMVKHGGQYQIIIGTSVSVVAEAAMDILGLTLEAEIITSEKNTTDSLFNRFFKTISGCISPFMGLLIASGMIKGLLTLFVSVNLIHDGSGIYQLLYAGADGLMYFLPILVAFSVGRKFGANPYLTAAVGAALVYPNIVALYNEGTPLNFLGIPVVLTSYGNSLFPALLAAWVTAKVERFWKKVIPDMITLMFVPFLTLLVVVPITFLAIGPVMTVVSDLLASGTEALWGFSPIFAGVILGAFWQVIVIFGLHYAFIPILINNIAQRGVDPINAVLGMTVMALAGAGIGYTLKVRDREKKVEAFTCSLTAFFGVTEPIIYSLAIPERKPFICAFAGGAIAGGVLAASGAAMQGFGNGGIFQAFMMIEAGNPSNLLWFFVASVIAATVSAVLCFIVTKSES